MWLMVPTSVNVNAVTKTNWQGIGVIPDIKIKSERAFLAAQELTYKELAAAAGNAKVKSMYEWLALSFEAKAHPLELSVSEMTVLAGSYADERRITREQNNLYYERVGSGEKKKLIPLSNMLFELEGSSFFRVRFIKNEKGVVTALEGIYDDGEIQVSKRM